MAYGSGSTSGNSCPATALSTKILWGGSEVLLRLDASKATCSSLTEHPLVTLTSSAILVILYDVFSESAPVIPPTSKPGLSRFYRTCEAGRGVELDYFEGSLGQIAARIEQKEGFGESL